MRHGHLRRPRVCQMRRLMLKTAAVALVMKALVIPAIQINLIFLYTKHQFVGRN
jgi:hypothetical protein